jgi:Secretion system C-terminal sorting domain
MKKILLLLFIGLINQNFVNAQEPLNVVITEDCIDASGIYEFNGLVNGKNNYVYTVTIDDITTVIGLGFNGTKWVLYANGDLTDTGFENIAVPVGMLPPFIGWYSTGCSNGTMTISQSLSTNNTKIETNISVYPNPSAHFIVVENSINNINFFDYNIIDITGRVLFSGNAKYNEKINTENFTKGNYILSIKDTEGNVFNKKLIKN